MNTKLSFYLLIWGLPIIGLMLFGKFEGKEKKHLPPAGISGDDIGEYYLWEQKRLADPSTGMIPGNIRYLELQFAQGLPTDEQNRDDKPISSAAAAWQSIGPMNIGGRTRAFAADVNNEAILNAGSCAGGMWRSTDSGKHWALTTPLAIQQSVSCLAQDIRPKHSNIWYYGSGEADGASASASAGALFVGNGVYRSKDDGQTWTSLPKTASNELVFGYFWQAIWSIATNPAAPDSLSVVYASAIGEVNRSSDTGNTWTTVLGGNSDYSQYTDVKVSPKGIVYATLSSSGFYNGNWSDSVGEEMGIWRSEDGINFTNITPPNFPHEYNRIVIGISPLDENQVYFLVNTVNSGMPDTNFLGEVEWDGLWKYKYLSGTGDSTGGAWWNLTPNLPHTGGIFDKYNSQVSYDMAVEFLPNDTSTVFIGGTDIFRSTAGFFDATHTAHIGGYGVGAHLPNIMVYPGHHPDQHVFFFSKSNPYIMYNGCDGGLFKTLNDTAKNVVWSTLNPGYVTTMFYTVNSNRQVPGSQVIVGGTQDNDCLFDNSPALSNNWTKPIFGDGQFDNIADSGKLFYFSNTVGHLFKAQMDTATGTVTAFNRIDPIGGKNYEWLNPSVIDPNNNNIMYLAGGKYLWRNNNLAAIPLSNQWDSISAGWVQFPDSMPVRNADITAIAVSTTPANRVYIGTSDGEVYRIDSANIGFPKFKSITAPHLFTTGVYVTCIAVDPNNADIFFVEYCNYGVNNLFYTSNGGKTFTNEGGNLNGKNQPSLRWVAFQDLPSGDTNYWVAASTGLYSASTLKGRKTVWVQQGASTIGNMVCDMVDVRPSDGLIAVATHGHGIYTSYINTVTATPDITNPLANNGFNVYPNPSAGSFHIAFELQNELPVILSLYDLNGNLAFRNNYGMMTEGTHTLDINNSNLSSGLYFVSLKQGEDVKTERALIVR